jgi:hypothetical protein
MDDGWLHEPMLLRDEDGIPYELNNWKTQFPRFKPLLFSLTLALP